MTIEDTKEPHYFDWIPNEMVCEIFKYLDAASLGNIRQTCIRLYNISCDVLICDAAVKRTVNGVIIPEVQKFNLKLGMANLVPLFLKSVYENVPHYCIEGNLGSKSSRHIRQAFRAFLQLTSHTDPKASIMNLKLRSIQVNLDGDRLAGFMRLLPIQLIRWTPITVVDFGQCIRAINASLEEDELDESGISSVRDQMVFKTSSSEKFTTIYQQASTKLLAQIGDLIPARYYLTLAIDSRDHRDNRLMREKIIAFGNSYQKINLEFTMIKDHTIMMAALVLAAYYLRDTEHAIDCETIASWFGETRYALNQVIQLVPSYFHLDNHPIVVAFSSDEFRTYWGTVFDVDKAAGSA